MTYQLYEFKHFKNSRIQKIVPPIVSDESIYYWCKQITFDNVPIIKFIFQGNYFSHKPESTWKGKQYVCKL